jgi:hypothetical protein
MLVFIEVNWINQNPPVHLCVEIRKWKTYLKMRQVEGTFVGQTPWRDNTQKMEGEEDERENVEARRGEIRGSGAFARDHGGSALVLLPLQGVTLESEKGTGKKRNMH